MNRFVFAAALAVVSLSAQARERKPETVDSPNTVTHGQVQMTLRVGETSQYQVLEAFGAPNITTMDGNSQEVWVYDRHATVSRDESGGFSIGLGIGGGGGGVGAVGGLGFGKKKAKSETSSRTMTLVIKFDDRKIVSDFRSRSSSF